MFPDGEERANLQALRARQRREVTIDVVWKACIDPGHREPCTTGKENFRRRLDEERLSPMQHCETRWRGRIARDESSIRGDAQDNEEDPLDHASRIPDRPHAALSGFDSCCIES